MLLRETGPGTRTLCDKWPAGHQQCLGRLRADPGKICRWSGSGSKFVEHALNGKSQALVVAVDRSWVLSYAGGTDALGGCRHRLDGLAVIARRPDGPTSERRVEPIRGTTSLSRSFFRS
jgi:hypothetical protein